MTRVAEVRLRLQQTAPVRFERRNEPVTIGLPLPRGLAYSTADWAVCSGDAKSAPLQTRVLERWSNGSIRWALVDFQATVNTASEAEATLVLGTGPASPAASIDVLHTGQTLRIDTGAALFSLSGSAPILFADVMVNGLPAMDPTASMLTVTSGTGQTVQASWQPPVIDEEGPLRTVVYAEGEARYGANAPLHLFARLHFFAGSPVVRLLLTVRNPRRAAHPGGYWELGDAGSMLVKDVSLVLRRPHSAVAERLCCSVEPGEPAVTAREGLEVYQDSSGGENWVSTNHVNRHGVVPNTFRGYRFRADGDERRGLRATPLAWLEGGGVPLGATLPQFWQNFPRVMTATTDSLRIGLWPGEYADLHELQGGEQKTHEFFLLFGSDAVTEMPLAWCRSRLLAAAAPEWYASAEAMPGLTPAASNPDPDYEVLVNAAVEGDDTFFDKRERVDEYGWRHFGDIYGDHEAVRQPGDRPLVSHYNNQYDAIAGFAIQFMRSGDARWWTQCADLAAHVVDIDIYHTTEDKAAYNNGLFWHTVHYIDAGKATHRSYPKAPGSPGGGPASEHNYSTGLMLHHFLTGDAGSRQAAVGLAQFVIDMDDGGKTVFRWLDRGPTGLATASRSPLFHGPGRGSGNSLSVLVDSHRLTGDRRFLEKAEGIIKRCVHPGQDIAALALLDTENRWFYTMFLQALGKYLVHKTERGELDAMYAYGHKTLLHFARWMADHEYPYLDKPENLEFPTETWPAQDMRKSEVFNHAARHAQGWERTRFLERARAFHDYSVRTLERAATRALARPVVLMLSHGFSRARLVDGLVEQSPAPPALANEFERPKAFIAQKVRALRRMRTLAGLTGILGLAGLLGVALVLLF